MGGRKSKNNRSFTRFCVEVVVGPTWPIATGLD
jgi:hypothetical protein